MDALLVLVIGVVIGWFTAQFETSKKLMAKLVELWVWIKSKFTSSTPEPPAPTT